MKKNALKKSLSLLLALVMVIGLLPATALAAHDPNTGRPTDLDNPVYLSILTAGNSFPGEPTVSNPGNYTGISSTFTAADGTFSDTAENILNQEILNEVTQGVASGVVDHVWGVYDVAGMTNWFTDTFKATLTQNNEKIIKAVLGQDVTASNYEIVWYVIKYQDTSRWWENGYPDGWHIDGLIREASKYSVNYNGNGATGGSVPTGVTDIGSGYTVQDKGSLVRSGALGYTFTGWNTASDGSGTAYNAGDVITRADYPNGTTSMTLYAQWKARTGYIATVNTYLNGLKRDASAIHDTELTLHLSKDGGQTFTDLTHSNTGVYTAIVENGTYSLYRKETNGNYEQVGDHTLVISNANGGLDVHHYSVEYDPNGGTLPGGTPEPEILFAGGRVDVVAEAPTRSGYYFTGWKDLDGTIYQPGQHLTTDIQKQHHLVAQWAEAVDVSVTLIVNNQSSEGDLDDVSARDARITLTHLLPNEESYTEVNNSSQTKHDVPVPTPDGGTAYEKLYTGLDPSVPYSANVFMHNYKISSRVETVDANGNYHVTITLQYDPAGFDLEYNIVVDSSVPDEHIPTAIDLKISYWDNETSQWRYIDEHNIDVPGSNSSVDVSLGKIDNEPASIGPRKGVGHYHVWGFEEENLPYYYRVEVIGIDYDGQTTLAATESLSDPNEVYQALPYVATVSVSNGGTPSGSTLSGACASTQSGSTTVTQNGVITVTITMNSYDVTFDANGGKVNSQDSQTVSSQYQIPDLDSYVPTREGGYVFDGWYYDADNDGQADDKAAGGEWLSDDITLVAQWKAPLTIQGTVLIDGSYMQDSAIVDINDIDRPLTATVRLWESGQQGALKTVEVENLNYGSEDFLQASFTYKFEQVPDNGREYQIVVEITNYESQYDNESDDSVSFSPEEYTAVFGDDRTAVIDAHLLFNPDSYDQQVLVDASPIHEDFRPTKVLAEIYYRDLGDIHPYNVITQHTVAPFGISVELDSTGNGSGQDSVWKSHYNGTLYEYRARISKLYGNVDGVFTAEGVAYSTDAPFEIQYSQDATVWDSLSGTVTGGEKDRYGVYSGQLKATIIPKEYIITFDLNLPDGVTAVTGMDSFKSAVDSGTKYSTSYTWSWEEDVAAAPVCEGYVFTGWTKSGNAYGSADGTFTVAAGTAGDFTLVAAWKEEPYYTVQYLKQATTVPVAPEKTVTSQSYGTEVTENAINVPGYSLVSESSQTINLDYGENIIIFYYAPRTDLSYTVKYLEQGSNKVLAQNKTVGSQTLGAEVTADAVDIPGYDLVSPTQQTITIGGGENLITFYYTPRHDLTLTVKYRDLETGIYEIHPDTEISGMVMGAEVKISEELDIPIDGYRFDRSAPASYTMQATDNVITLYYEKLSYGYTVEYYYDGVFGSRVDKTAQPFGTIINVGDLQLSTQDTKDTKTYALDYVTGAPLTISSNASANVIKVYYASDEDGSGVPDKYRVTVTYRVFNGTWSDGSTGDLVATFDLKKWEDGVLVDAHPTLGTPTQGANFPTGMLPNTGYTQGGGHWDEGITSATPVTVDVTYNYRFHEQNKYDILIRVVNGSIYSVNNDTYGQTEYTYEVTHDTEAYTYFMVAPNAGYTLESIVVDGDTKDSIPQGLAHTGHHYVIVTYGRDEDNDGTPDSLQKKVTFKVVNGQWNAGGSNDIVDWVNSSSEITKPIVGSAPDEGHQAGTWVITSGTEAGLDPVTYTYTYAKQEFTIIIDVEGGTSSPAPSEVIFEYDPTSKQVVFTPFNGYILDSFTVTKNGQPVSNATLSNLTYQYDHAHNWTIKAVFKADLDNSGIADVYERKVIFKIENGTWSNGSSANQTVVAHLQSEGNLDENGIAVVTVPTGMLAGAGFNQSSGKWDRTLGTAITVTESSPDIQTFTFSFDPSVVTPASVPYYVEHYLQRTDGTYTLEEQEEKALSYNLVDNVVDETSYQPTLTGGKLIANTKNFGTQYTYHTTGGTIDNLIVSNNSTSVSLSGDTMKLYYSLAQYDVTYLLNEGTPGIGVDYDDQKDIFHGSRVALKPAPIRSGYSFMGWFVDQDSNGKLEGAELGLSNAHFAGNVGTLIRNVQFIAHWEKRSDLSYTVNYRELGPNELIETSEIVTNQVFDTTINRSDLPAELIKTIEHFTFDPASSTDSITIGVGYNVIDLYYTRNSYGYTVEYHYGNVKDDSQTVTGNTAPYGSTISTYVDKSKPGYEFEKVESVTITDNLASNVLKVHYKPTTNSATVTFKVVNGTWADGSTADKTVTVTLSAGKGTLSEADVPTGMKANSGYEGGAWDVVPSVTVDGITGSVTYTYTFTRSSDGSSPISPEVYGSAVLTKVDANDPASLLEKATFRLYRVSGGSETLVGTYTTDANGKIVVNILLAGDYYWRELRAPEGYKLDATKHHFTVSVGQTAQVTVTNTHSSVPDVFTDQHYSYVIGYPDGMIHPEANITRAEVATIFFRLLTEAVRNQYLTRDNSFSDVSENHWFNTAVSTMAAMGVINGYPDDTFRPNASITRAEFAAICARFDEYTQGLDASFEDVYGHWAEDEIAIAVANGWLVGYEDDTFHPNQKITRAEAMTVINRVMQRIPGSVEDLLPNMIQWPDNMNTTKWYYLAVQEATNSHTYDRNSNGREYWIALIETPDWSKIGQ